MEGFPMNKTNKITMLMLTGVLSLGLMSNSIYCAAAPETPENSVAYKTPAAIARELIAAFAADNENEAKTIMRNFITTATRDEIMIVTKEIFAANYLFDMAGIISIIMMRTSAKIFIIGDILLEIQLTTNDKLSNAERITILNQRLLLALQEGSIDNAKSFLDQGADANAIDTTTGASALMFAAIKGDANIVQLLISRGANAYYEIKKTDKTDEIDLSTFARLFFQFNNA